MTEPPRGGGWGGGGSVLGHSKGQAQCHRKEFFERGTSWDQDHSQFPDMRRTCRQVSTIMYRLKLKSAALWTAAKRLSLRGCLSRIIRCMIGIPATSAV